MWDRRCLCFVALLGGGLGACAAPAEAPAAPGGAGEAGPAAGPGPGAVPPAGGPEELASAIAATPRPPRPEAVPPPISGGTLVVARDGRTAAAADPDRDRVVLVDLAQGRVRGEIALRPGDEPGRGAEDGAGRLHVALRGGGALVTVDLATATITHRRGVCPAPRGVAYQAAGDLVHVACQGGQLVSLKASGGPPVRTLRIADDLRDVVVQRGRLFVSRFRAAQLLELDAAGQVSGVWDGTGDGHSVAWRTILLPEGASPGGALLMLHQRAEARTVPNQQGGWGRPITDPCSGSGLVQAALTYVPLSAALPQRAPTIVQTVLPVDVAVSPDGQRAAIVSAGTGALRLLPATALRSSASCTAGDPPGWSAPTAGAIAVAYAGDGALVAQLREPPMLIVNGNTIPLGGAGRADRGHALFHGAVPQAMLACASCHPEATDDGRVWSFAPDGPRRTMSLRGGLLGTEPFHWGGDLQSLKLLVDEVMTKRMNGPVLGLEDAAALGRWLDAQPALPLALPEDAAATERGRLLFGSAEVGCAACHQGGKLTDSQTVDVGTGGAFQVPSLLGVAARAPFLHTGAAPTLEARFTDAGGGDRHGRTSGLSPAQLKDLVTYLKSL